MGSRCILILLAGLFAAVLAAGCSRDAGGGGKELRFCFFGNYEDWTLWGRIARIFEAENPGVRVKLLYWPGVNYEDKVRLVMAAGTAPDVIDVQDESFPNYCSLNQFVDLAPYLKRDGAGYARDLFFPTALETFRWSGKQYGLPWNGGQIQVYYNKTLFREAGLPIPPPKDWTIEDFTEYAVKLTRDIDGDGRIDQFGFELNLNWMYHLIPFIWIWGGDILNPEMTRCTLNTPEGIACLQWLHDLRWKYRCAPTAAEFAGASGSVFMTGRLGMEVNGPWRLPFMRETEGFEWDVWHMPVGPGGERWTRGTWDGLALYRRSKLKEEGWNFIRLATSQRGQLLVSAMGRALPARRSAAYTDEFIRPDTPQNEEIFLEGMEYFRTQRIPLKWAQMDVILKRETERLLLRDGDARATAERSEREINAILDR